MARLFGTDGIRGVANTELTPELATAVGRAAARELADGNPTILVARDTRLSGGMLEAALTAGMLSAGADVLRCGVLPTPAAAHLVGAYGASAAAVISASHNPYRDNGIKFFGPQGFKLSDEAERRIEDLVEAGQGPSSSVGGVRDMSDPQVGYVSHALAVLGSRRLDGLKVVVDCAHGAAYRTTPEAFRKAGAEVVVLNADPDGININLDCGSTAPEGLAAAVVEHSADLGLAHDGDADRVIAVDEAGEIVDGDAIIAALAMGLKEEGRLKGDLVVTTVMANLGFRRAMSAAEIEVVETAVGDRYVLEAMLQRDASIGGEQSGHVILLEHATTGDGLITGLCLLDRMLTADKRLSELAAVVHRYPQVLRNVRVADREGLSASEAIWNAASSAEEDLGQDGRVLIRASGTEPLVRVMVEASDEPTAERIAADLAGVITDELGEVVEEA